MAARDERNSAKFELFEDRSGQYRWRLVHSNGNIIADSGEGYATKQKAKQGIESVKQNASDAEVVEEEP
ncbi:HVO_2922 family protein [Halobellus sp. EA9]|uniref:HVO_2922 family protein n=1 Tax=Halobellus sp. EA9 TaxID=3421647 RepID=UPI003EBE882A